MPLPDSVVPEPGIGVARLPGNPGSTPKSLLSAARFATVRPATWAVGLAGFLARGGIVPFLVPILVVPSVVGIATFIGADAITVAGLSTEFIAQLAVAGFVLAAWLVIGTLIGAAADVSLIRSAPAGIDGSRPAPADLGRGAVRGLVVRLAAIRLALILPLVAVSAWGASRVVTVGYGELTQPGDLATPFLVRVLEGVPDVAVAVAVAWLAGELIGCVAVRLVVIEGRSPGRAIGMAVARIVRRPLAALAIAFVTLGLSIVAIAPVLALAALAWNRLVTELLAQAPSWSVILPLAVAFVAAWLVALAVAGFAAAWRSLAWSLFVTRDHRGAGGRDSERATL